MYGIIYVIANTVNGKQYVGQTTHTLEVCWCGHLKLAREGSQCALSRAIRRHGADAFEIKQIDFAETLEELNEKEVHHISKLRTFVPGGYNLTLGGDGVVGYSHTEEICQKLSKVLLGHTVSGETRRKQSEAAKGRVGWHHSEETCQKMSEAHRGRTVSEETRLKMSEAQLFRSSDTEETRRKKSESAKLRHYAFEGNAD